MGKITFVAHDNTEHVAEFEAGVSLMQIAVDNAIPGIDGDCGGAAACATCHVYVDPAWIAKTGTAGDGMEKDMLDFAEDVRETSRLACQINITEDLDGLVLKLPEKQH